MSSKTCTWKILKLKHTERENNENNRSEYKTQSGDTVISSIMYIIGFSEKGRKRK